MPLDLKMLIDMPGGTIFSSGLAMDHPDGLFMANTGKKLRWVAVRDYDRGNWSVYCHIAADHTINEIARIGDKVHDDKYIRFCVPCDDEALAHYRR